MNKLKLFFFIFLNFVFIQIYNAQTQAERKSIIQNYDIEELHSMFLRFSNAYEIEKKRAIKYALQNDIDIIIKKEDGGISILQKVLSDGTPIYVSTYNAGSAITINTNKVYSGGENGLSLSGKDIVFGIWDGGRVRSTHQELIGRVTQLDNPGGLSGHATHVSGTMIASGVLSEAKGMAFNGELLAYDFNNDISEMTSEASNGMLISNHSYGLTPSSIPQNWFGAYLSITSNIDNLTYNAQNYLPVFAAGNSNNAFPPFNPSKNGYDLISGLNLAKNILSVANVKQVLNYVDASSVEIWEDSSWGPTDDGRIKPDISAKGSGTLSSIANADDSYAPSTGTSMAAPAVSGSIGLLQEHYNNLYNSFLSAASMRALVIHTAREAGEHPGPDYIFGWGLMDTAAAADVITNNNFTTIVEENTLNEGETYTFTVKAADPNTPLKATLTWTDPPGPIQDVSVTDDPTPRLVNDLDLRIIAPDAFTEFLPWSLSVSAPEAAAAKADNIVDNVEKIEIANAEGEYTIEVSHKGNLQDLLQNYSLIVSGIEVNDFVLTTNQAYKSFCSNDLATFDIDINSISSFSDSVNLTQSGLPSSFSVAFSSPSINGQGSSVLSIDNLTSQPEGDYPFIVTASSGSDSYSFEFSLNTRPIIPMNDVIMVNPVPGSSQRQGVSPTLVWNPIPEAFRYEVDLSTTSSFDNIVFSAETDTNELSISELNDDQTYYFRIRSINDCLVGNYTVDSFTTKSIECEAIILSSDTPVVIDDSSTSLVQATVTVDESLAIYDVEDVNVTIDITHSNLSDLIVKLTSPNGTSITLLDQACGALDDLNVIFDDKGIEQDCDLPAIPALSGVIIPKERLSAFVGEPLNGDWILSVEDNTSQFGGSINTYGIEFCYEQTLSASSKDFSEFNIHPNPSKGIAEVDFGQNIPEEMDILVFDINGRVLKTFQATDGNSKKVLDLNDLQSGMYFVKVSTQNFSTTKKLIIK